jgi:uncharacterized protein (TIGR03435 family)
MKTKVESRDMWSGWKAVSSLAGCAALTVLLAIGSQANRATAQSPTPAAQTAAPAATAQPSAPASPTDLAGIWQGTLTPPNAPKGIRFVIKITKAADGSYKAALYNADQGQPPLTFTTVTLQGTDVKLVNAALTIAGKMSIDGKTIDGNFSGFGPNPLPVSFSRVTPDAAWPILEAVKPMAADADPGVDVATIKPSQPGRQGKGFGFNGTHFRTFNTNVNDLIAISYGMHAKQIVGAPDWLGTDLFDIDVVPDMPGRPSIKQMGLILQILLADRFALKFHHDQRELAVYAIQVGAGGPKMKVSASGPNDQQGFGFRGLGDLVVINLSMKEFATWMQSSVMDKPVVDQTGLTDRYDFTLKWTPDDSQFAQFRGAVTTPPPAGDNPNAPPSLYTAMQEQLGLKFSATKAMDDVIVIDHVEKPSPN